MNLNITYESKSLKPLQKNLNYSKLFYFILSYLNDESWINESILGISLNPINLQSTNKDIVVMDGHHRLFASFLINPEKKLNCIIQKIPLDNLLKMIEEYYVWLVEKNIQDTEFTSIESALIKLVEIVEKSYNDGFVYNSKNTNGEIIFSSEKIKELLIKMPNANGDSSEGLNTLINNIKNCNLKNVSNLTNLDIPNVGVVTSFNKGIKYFLKPRIQKHIDMSTKK